MHFLSYMQVHLYKLDNIIDMNHKEYVQKKYSLDSDVAYSQVFFLFSFVKYVISNENVTTNQSTANHDTREDTLFIQNHGNSDK